MIDVIQKVKKKSTDILKLNFFFLRSEKKCVGQKAGYQTGLMSCIECSCQKDIRIEETREHIIVRSYIVIKFGYYQLSTYEIMGFLGIV
jgi:hypothetical protein